MFWEIRKYFEILKPVLSLKIYHKVDTKQIIQNNFLNSIFILVLILSTFT
jgi:hypothetical protein